jgi:hypothetical protein
MSGFHVQAGDVRSQRLPGIVGMLVMASMLNELDTVINKSPQAKQVGEIVVDTAANDTDYTVTINGVDITITSDADGTKPEIAAALAAAINAEPLVRGQVEAESDGVDTVTLTGTFPGLAFTASDADANLTTTEEVTAAADAEAIPFGRLVCSTGYTDEGNKHGFLAKSSLLTAQVDSMVVTYAAGEIYSVGIDIDGETYWVHVAADTDTDTTGAAIVAAINAIMPANTVLAAYTAGSDTITLTAEVAGKAFETKRGLKSGTIARLTLVHTTSGVATDVTKAAAGVSLHTYDEEIPAGETEASYPANAGLKVCRKGLIWVENSESPSVGDPVYVELAAGANSGKFYKTSSATRVLLPNARWERAAGLSTDNLAQLKFEI